MIADIAPRKGSAVLLRKMLEQLQWRLGIHIVSIFSRQIKSGFDPGADGLEFRLLEEGELAHHCADPALEMTADWAREAMARGDECIAALDRGVLVGYVWSSLTRAPDRDGVWVEVPPGGVYRYKSFVVPAYRGRNVAPRLYHCRNADAVARGRTFTVGFIAAHNAPSIAAARRSGGRFVGWVAYWPRAGRLVAFHSRGVRQFGLRFVRP
jgi:GNAT superfamily N-acetyltransferase